MEVVKVKQKIKNFFIRSKNIFKNNIFLSCYVIGATFNGFLVRALTIQNYFGITPILADFSVSLLIGGLSLFIKESRRNTYLLILTVISSFFSLANALYFGFYDSFVSITFISFIMTNYDTGGVNTAQNILSFKYLILLIYPFFMFGLNLYLRKNKHLIKSGHDKESIKLAFSWGSIIFFLFLSLLKPIDYSRFYSQWNREYLVSRFGVYCYQLNDIIKSIEPKLSEMFGSDQAYLNFKNYFANKEDNSKKNKYTNIYKGKNVIVIHAESLQGFVINKKFNGNAVTPTLNKLTKEGLYFSNFYSQVSVGTSSDTEFTFLTSLMPVNSGTVFINHYDKEYISIPKLLSLQGYKSYSMHANNGSFWNRKNMHKNLGYNKMYDKSSFTIDDVIGFGLSDKSFFTQSVPIIKQISEEGNPFFITSITLSNHTPFGDVDKYGDFDVTLTKNGEVYPYLEGTKLGNYIKSVHYADMQIGLFLYLLDKEGLLENTVVIIYGDHDARLSKNEYNYMYNYDPNTNNILNSDDPNYVDLDYYWYELNRKVPFIIWTKNGEEKKEITKVMGMYDVMPTLGNIMGFKNDYALGNDIFSVKNNIVVFPNGNFVTDKVYYNEGKGEYKLLIDKALDENYISNYRDYAQNLLKVSNNIVVYDLIKKENLKE